MKENTVKKTESVTNEQKSAIVTAINGATGEQENAIAFDENTKHILAISGDRPEKWGIKNPETINIAALLIAGGKIESIANDDNADIFLSQVIKKTGFYTCEQLTEYSKREGIIMPSFWAKKPETIYKLLKKGIYKTGENIQGEKIIFPKKTPDISANYHLFLGIYKLCKRFQNAQHGAKKTVSDITEKIENACANMYGLFQGENKGFFEEERKNLCFLLDKAKRHNDGVGGKYAIVAIPDIFREFSELQWETAKAFFDEKAEKIGKIVNKTLENLPVENEKIPTLADVLVKFREYSQSIDYKRENTAQKTLRETVSKMLETIARNS